jgi:hypothetical protein
MESVARHEVDPGDRRLALVGDDPCAVAVWREVLEDQ